MVLRTTLVARLTRHSWNVACNTRCLQGSEEVRGRVLQCNYYVMEGWCCLNTENGSQHSAFNLSMYVLKYVRPRRAKFLQPVASTQLREHATIVNLIYFHWGSLATFLCVARLLKISNARENTAMERGLDVDYNERRDSDNCEKLDFNLPISGNSRAIYCFNLNIFIRHF